MAAWEWTYPYSGSTAVVSFNSSPGSPTDQWRMDIDNPAPNQVSTRTLNHGVRVYELGTAGRIITLTFSGNLQLGASATASAMYGYLGVVEFLKTHTEYGIKTFGFLDPEGGAEIEVRYLGGVESFQRNKGGRYAGTIRLSEEIT